MSVSDAEANANLDLLVSAGGSWWVGLSTTTPDADLSPASITDAGLALQELSRDGATTWEPAADRHVQPLAGLDFGVTSVEVVPAALIFYADAAGTIPARSALVADVLATPGSHVVVPAAALGISVPPNPTHG